MTLLNKYSGERRLQTLENLTSSGAQLSKFDYVPDPEGQITSWTKQIGATPALSGTYTYNLADELTRATTATVTPPANFVYDYDFAGNRKTDQQGTITHTFNEVNEITDPGFLYDDNGNLTSDGVTGYEWDAANRLVAIEKTVMMPASTSTVHLPTPSPTPSPQPTPPINVGPLPTPIKPVAATVPVLVRSEFSYDGLGRRVRVTEKQASVGTNGNQWETVSDNRYIWNGNTLAEERDSEYPTVVTKRFFTEGEQINGENYFYTRDHLGSIRELLDSTGAVRAQYEYDPFGNRTKLSGDLDASFGFTGHWHHGLSGLNLALYRAYSPTLGRWISRDPLENAELVQGPNLYTYVRNNPINFVDPDGRLSFDLRDWLIPTLPWDNEHRESDEERRHGDDNYRHCLASCRLARRFGPLGGAALIEAYNRTQEYPHWDSDSQQDVNANWWGYLRSWLLYESCRERCRGICPR